jgi:hypothetical protein
MYQCKRHAIRRCGTDLSQFHFPALSVFSFNELVGFVEIGDFHIGCIP